MVQSWKLCLGLVQLQQLSSSSESSFISHLQVHLTSLHLPVMLSSFRSLVTQAISKDEVGRIFSINSLIGSILGSLVSSAYLKIYNLTLDTLPGAYLLVASALILLTVPLNLIAMKLLQTFEHRDCNKLDEDQENTKL